MCGYNGRLSGTYRAHAPTADRGTMLVSMLRWGIYILSSYVL